ncbi:MAG TPA: GNAT family N-acetyltransferase [Candidatus Cybelea sp.]|nr:GNAT family N-acetyltransferase [Candidatus Cybelea sp.]
MDTAAIGYRIRSYADADRPVLRRMLNALQEAECAMEPNRAHWADGGEAYAAWMLDEIARSDGAVFLAIAEDGAPIGLVSCWRAEDETDITVTPAGRVHLYVSDLYVEPEWRGRGVAGALLAEAERHGRGLGIRQMTIGTLAVNEAARKAYAKAGFADYEMLLRKPL